MCIQCITLRIFYTLIMHHISWRVLRIMQFSLSTGVRYSKAPSYKFIFIFSRRLSREIVSEGDNIWNGFIRAFRLSKQKATRWHKVAKDDSFNAQPVWKSHVTEQLSRAGENIITLTKFQCRMQRRQYFLFLVSFALYKNTPQKFTWQSVLNCN